MNLTSALRRLLPDKKPRSETPTSSLYFTEAMKEYLADGGPVTRLEPNVFRCAETIVIVRHWAKPTTEALKNEPDLGVVYLIDDDLWASDGEQHLPAAYRRRLIKLREDFDKQLSSRVQVVVSPSQQILAHFANLETRQLDPGLIYDLSDLSHHDAENKTLDLVFSATASHIADLDIIAAPLSAYLTRSNNVTLTTYLGRQSPQALKLPNCTHHDPQSWEAFRKGAGERRFHIGLAPMIDTAFNRGRSISRMFDHAAMGAVGLYSNVPPFSDRIDDGADGWLLENSPEDWIEKIEELAKDVGARKRLAEATQFRVRALGQLERIRTFWSDLLGL